MVFLHTHLILIKLDVPSLGDSLLADLLLIVPPGSLQQSFLLLNFSKLLLFKSHDFLTLFNGITDLPCLLRVMGGVYFGFDVLGLRLAQDMLLDARQQNQWRPGLILVNWYKAPALTCQFMPLRLHTSLHRTTVYTYRISFSMCCCFLVRRPCSFLRVLTLCSHFNSDFF